ncbi:phenylacetate--CoA ligase family protein [Nitriliruptor alkaliphilus]|uniref:phenylacetate--CoA ligase family protein n=1 Tax=Nitriliruptor alkaliphilus TaxID=427918 RepID=UPI0006984BBC|nr:phenylacetate--CoA ligase [Nitriliruptor alkaliphilus]
MTVTDRRRSSADADVDVDAELRWTVQHAYQGAAFFRDLLDGAGVDPSAFRGRDDLRHLPFTTKDQLRACSPWGWTAVPLRDVVRIHSSSGTTGKRTICTYTAADIESWTAQFARCYEYAGVGPSDRVQLAVGYGMWTAGIGFQTGAERVGAMAIPTGPGDTALQMTAIRELGTTVLGATASFALLLAELVERESLREHIDLRVGIFGSERWGEATRRRIEERLGIETFDIYGLTELWGPGVGIECSRHDGIHVWSDHYLVEIVDPDTLAPVPDGEPGELILTTFRKEGTPLLRYRTRDVSRILPGPCACGSPHPRIARLTGRTDDAIKVRGVLLLPAQIDLVLGDLGDSLSGEFQVHVTRDAAGRDEVQLVVEAGDDAGLGAVLADRLRHAVGLRFAVEVVPIGHLPRSERKTKRVFDHREEGS